MRKRTLFLTSAIFVGCTGSGNDNGAWSWCGEQSAGKPATRLTFGDLNSRFGASLHGSCVVMTGRLSYRLEDIALYPLEGSVFQPVWLDLEYLPDSLHALLIGFHTIPITITGTLDTVNKGFLNEYSCTVKNISCMQTF